MFEWFDVCAGWIVRFALMAIAIWTIAAAIEDKSHYTKTVRDKCGALRVMPFTWRDYFKTFNVWAILAVVAWILVAIPTFGSIIVH